MPLAGKEGLASCDNMPSRVVLACTLGFSVRVRSGHTSCLVEEGLYYLHLTNSVGGHV